MKIFAAGFLVALAYGYLGIVFYNWYMIGALSGFAAFVLPFVAAVFLESFVVLGALPRDWPQDMKFMISGLVSVGIMLCATVIYITIAANMYGS
jgi:hypothetical protein